MTDFARLINVSDSVVFDFDDVPQFISLFPEGGEQRIEGEYVLSVDGNGDPVPGGKIVKFLPTTDVGKKISVSGTMTVEDAATINTRYKAAGLQLFEALKNQQTYSFYVQMAEPKWTPGIGKDSAGKAVTQYSIDLYIQYTV